MTAFNEVGEGLPSDPVHAKTLGVAPVAPRQSSFLRANATHAALYLSEWQDGGCAIAFFVVQYRMEVQGDWILLSDHLSMQLEPFDLDGLVPGTWYRLHVTAHNDAGSTEAEYTFSTSVLNDASEGAVPMPERKGVMPFYTNLAIVAPVVVTVVILVSVLIVVCALSKRRNGDRHYDDTQSVRKEINSEAVQMSDYEVKQDGTYVQAAKESLYFPSPYATSRVPVVFSLDERSSNDSSADGRSMDRPYDVPFAVNKEGSNTRHTKGSKSQSDVDHMYSFPNRSSSRHHHQGSTGSHRKEGRWSADVDDEYIGSEGGDCRPRSAVVSSSRWQCSAKQGSRQTMSGEAPFMYPEHVT